jgi:hypothetical protein
MGFLKKHSINSTNELFAVPLTTSECESTFAPASVELESSVYSCGYEENCEGVLCP